MGEVDYRKMRAELRQHIQRQMWSKGWKQTELAEYSGVALATISRVLNEKETLSLNALNKVTQAFEQPEGFYYVYFIAECFHIKRETPNLTKLLEFARACIADRHLEEIIKEISQHIIEMNSDIKENREHIFSLAEYAYQKKNFRDALLFYHQYIRLEENHTEQLAICYYRIFMIKRDGIYSAFTDAVKLQEHLGKLPMEYQNPDGRTFNMFIDAYLRVTYFLNVTRRWSELLHHCNKLLDIAKAFRNEELYGKALLYIGIAYTGLGKYEEALEVITEYEKINDKYRALAVKNRIKNQLLLNNVEVLESYKGFFRDEQDYVIDLSVLIPTYVRVGDMEKVTTLLQNFNNLIHVDVDCIQPNAIYPYMDIKIALADYWVYENNHVYAINNMLAALELSYRIGDIASINECIRFYTKHISAATPEQLKKFDSILSRYKGGGDSVEKVCFTHVHHERVLVQHNFYREQLI